MSREPISHQLVRKEIQSIKDQAGQLDLEIGTQLESALYRLEMKINALRSYVWNNLIRDEVNQNNLPGKKRGRKRKGEEDT